MQVLVIAGVAGALALLMLIGWVVSIYNNLVQVRNNVEKAFHNIDVLLQQRHDEIPALVAIVRDFMVYEQDLLLTLTQSRERYASAATSAEKTAIENEFNRGMLRLTARCEAYPTLRSNEPFLHLQGRIMAIESAIADRRGFFNDSVNIHNTQIELFPNVLLSIPLGYTKRAFLEIPDTEKGGVSVSLG